MRRHKRRASLLLQHQPNRYHFTMKVFCLCVSVVLACLLASTEAGVSVQPAEVDPDRPNGCMWTNPRTNQRVFHANSASWKIGPCERATCKKEEGKFVLRREGCGVYAVEPPCRISAVDPTKIYPDCCPRPICT